MIENIIIKAKKGKAVKLIYRFKGRTKDYAIAWLHLTNNAREFPKIFLHHYNNDGNCVYVITPKKHRDEMVQYLNGLAFGEFKTEMVSEEEIETITPLVDWECTYTDDADDDVAVLPWDEI